MTTDPDPFEQGQHAARQGIPALANPYPDGSEQHALWADVWPVLFIGTIPCVGVMTQCHRQKNLAVWARL